MSAADLDTVQNANNSRRRTAQVAVGQSITAGFAIALAVWTTWFVTHLPWTGLSQQAQMGSVLAVWVIAAAVMSSGGTLAAGVGSGLVSALLGLLLLGSKLVEPSGSGPQAGPVKPNALVIAGGFLALGCAVGLAGHLIGRLIPRAQGDERPDWLARFAAVSAFTVAVLLFIGGLVTSTNSGMAVPDWPRTYGANMFLYPLSGAGADVFLEHSHRLFGTLVGLAAITLLVWTLVRERRGWVKVVAAIALALVIVQGVIGGFRVTENNRFLAMVHGVLGQLTFGLIVAMAAVLSPTFRRASGRCGCGYPLKDLPLTGGGVKCPECGRINAAPAPAEPLARGRRLRFFTTGLLHATILQLIFGAAHRHFRDNHSLYSHIAFSMVVLVFGVIAGFCAQAVKGDRQGMGPVLRRTGMWIVGVVGFQFILGWVAFLLGGREVPAATAGQALIRTVHQANGALLLALAVLAFAWTRRLLRTLR